MDREKIERRLAYNRHAMETATLVLAELSVQPGWIVGDIGAGGGYYSFRFADLVGQGGTVYAVDADQDMLDAIRNEAERQGLRNIHPILAGTDGPTAALPPCDLIFLRNVVHHLSRPEVVIRNLLPCLKPDGIAAVIEWLPGTTGPMGPRKGARPEEIAGMFSQAGFTHPRSLTFLPEQSFTLFSGPKVSAVR